MRVLLWIVILSVLPAVAGAVPGYMAIHGRLLQEGQPVEGSVDLAFRLYDSASAGTPLWQEELVAVPVAAGLYSVLIGVQTPLDPAQLAGASQLFLGLSVNSQAELAPRLPVGSVPFAQVAELAHGLQCDGCVAAPQVGFSYAGSTQAGGSALDLDCSQACVSTTELDNAAVTSAKVAVPITIGSLTATASAAGVGTSAPAMTLDVAGGVRLGAVATACAPAIAGTLQWQAASGALQLCTGSEWAYVPLARAGDGASAFTPAASCQAISAAGLSRGDGIYWLDPNGGSNADAFQAWCDMTRDGGGWTLIAKTAGSGNGHQSPTDVNLPALLNPNTNDSASLGDARRQALGRFYRFTCDGQTRYAYLNNTSLTVASAWGSTTAVLAWSATYSASPAAYTENSLPDCGTADCNGPGYGGRNWMRTSYGGCGLFNLAVAYGHAGTWWVK